MNSKNNYILSINKVMDYIDLNYSKTIELKDLEDISGFSKYHFHRLFKSLVNETIHHYINRIKLEKAAVKLMDSKETLTSIGLAHGFSDGAAFSNSFKKFFLVSPSAYRNNSKNSQDKKKIKMYDGHMKDSYKLIEEKQIYKKKQKLAYIRKTGAFEGDYKFFLEPYKAINDWRKNQKFLEKFISDDIMIYHDPLMISDDKTLRVSIGVTVPDSSENNEMNYINLSGGNYLVTAFEVQNHGYSSAWQSAYKILTGHDKMKLREDYAYELYPKEGYNKITQGTLVEIWLPIE